MYEIINEIISEQRYVNKIPFFVLTN